MNHPRPKPARRSRFSLRNRTMFATAVSTLMAGGLTLLPIAKTHAADTDDQSLKAQVAALAREVQSMKRELNVAENDSKGKDMAAPEPPPFMLQASKQVQKLVLSGDMRFRYAYDTNQGQSATGDTTSQRSREQFRFELFADYTLTDNFSVGAAIRTALGGDSGNSTISEGFDNYGVYLWRFFTSWKVNDNIRLTIGKMPNPFYSETELLFDSDISPTGLAQQLKFNLTSTFELDINTAEFIYSDNNENAERNPTLLANGTANPAVVKGGNNNTDAYLVYGQVIGTFKPTNKLTFTTATGFLTYPDNGGLNSPGSVTTGFNAGSAGNGFGQGGNVLQNVAAFNAANATRNLFLGSLSTDVKLDLGPVKVKVYTDAVYNFRGGARDSEEYGQPQLDNVQDKIAFASGFTIGNDFTIKKKHDALFLVEYRQVGLGSIDPNLNDSDFNDARLNFRGVKAAASYALEPWLIATATGFLSTNLGDEKNVGVAQGNLNTCKILYLDLLVQF